MINKDCTYILHCADNSAYSIIGTFQDEEKFFNYVKEIPLEKAKKLYVSKFINNQVTPTPLIDEMPIPDYLKIHEL